LQEPANLRYVRRMAGTIKPEKDSTDGAGLLNDVPRYTSLTDYLAVLRRQRLLIVVLVIAFAGGAYFISSRQTKSYVADAVLSLPTPSTDADPVGLPSSTQLPPDERAAINAQLVTRLRVAKQVKRRLHDPRPASQLLANVSARPETKTNFIVVEGTSTAPADAARLANGFATQFERQQTRAARNQLRRVSTALKRRLTVLRKSKSPADNYTTLALTDRVARTDALADLIRPVEVVRSAAVPGGAVSPKTTRDTILGALLGLIVGTLAAFGRDSLDRRMRTARDVEEQMKLSTLTRVGNRALGKAGGARKRRKALSGRDLEAFRILRANLRALGTARAPKVIAVTSAMPQEGKTTVASSLAWVNAASGRKTLLIECDLRRPALAKRMGLEQAPGLVEFLSGSAGAKEMLQEVPRERLGLGASNGSSESRSTLWCITAGAVAANSADVLDTESFRNLVRTLSHSYDSVILDTGPLLPVVDPLEVLPLADAVVFCVRASATTREQLAAAMATLERLPSPPLGLVVTGVRPQELRSYGYGYATSPAT
jgi:capsular exopolysaccharide synthesis family protein